MLILALDVSYRKTGYAVIDTSKKGTERLVERGRLKTRPRSIFLIRLLDLEQKLEQLLAKYSHSITHVFLEAPYDNGDESERLFATHMTYHRVFYKYSMVATQFSVKQIKKFATGNGDADKADMKVAMMKLWDIHGVDLPDDEADALAVAEMGHFYYHRYVSKTLSDEGLPELLVQVFSGKKTYTRGDKKGLTEYSGTIYKENRDFFDYGKIKSLKNTKQQEG